MSPQANPAPIPAAIGARLNAAIGVDPRALDPARLRWILKARCRHLKLPDAAAYEAFLADTPSELDELIDHVVVQETRFFRDPQVFDHIRHAALQLAAETADPLRMLSAPCGTGQEAYSLAALFASAGIPPARFTIDAVDISLSALATARAGFYPEHALTHVAPELAQACGERRNRQWRVHDALRDRIHFDRRNLAEPGSLGAAPRYHLILCRNLFIYLTPEARTALAASLAAALLPEGRLVLGTADRVDELSALFAPVRPASSFAFVHRPLAETRKALHAAATPRRAVVSVPRRPRPAPIPAPAAVAAEDPATAQEFLHRALEHQQRGELAKAERRCRQALYLAPNLLPALDLLETLWREHPNLRLRRALRDRILRNRLAAPNAAAPEPGWQESA